MKHFLLAIFLYPIFVHAQELNLAQATRLIHLPIKCMQQEYPNKMGQVLNDSTDLHSPKQLHPAFYGCFDWHSSVHGHWLIIRLLKEFPSLKNDSLIQALHTNIQPSTIEQEMAYFKTKNNGSFERTYGWNWVLKLQLELDTWQDQDGQKLADALRPLSNLLVEKYLEFIPKLNYPIRSGDHINTAFGLTFSFDYAVYTKNDSLQKLITQKAQLFYGNDQKYPLYLEPGGYDFLSPGMEEIDLMRRILPTNEFKVWLKKFAPQLFSKKFTLEPGVVSDRTDGHLVHLDGLNFSRAWCLFGLVRTLPELAHLEKIAVNHLNYSLPNIVDGDYMGEHWLASFAVLALFESRMEITIKN
ncbi:DUF2891 domain-containing protein [Fluviicola taffensis]|uniref:DUF2891 domain-containing protein n=1 Tax=Fluviicola taffensis (strain DSM 16823 / NCIMB 13979 / RW262) TaxID=755732 RepID=F2ID58_FLUTR|nr:DUF2891 domain-containing protein [Fluviicola taffensis]AEA44452.1 hypothetical protein Fluta_2467 [Fluviicola taffensis DSM 16823]